MTDAIKKKYMQLIKLFRAFVHLPIITEDCNLPPQRRTVTP